MCTFASISSVYVVRAVPLLKAVPENLETRRVGWVVGVEVSDAGRWSRPIGARRPPQRLTATTRLYRGYHRRVSRFLLFGRESAPTLALSHSLVGREREMIVGSRRKRVGRRSPSRPCLCSAASIKRPQDISQDWITVPLSTCGKTRHKHDITSEHGGRRRRRQLRVARSKAPLRIGRCVRELPNIAEPASRQQAAVSLCGEAWAGHGVVRHQVGEGRAHLWEGARSVSAAVPRVSIREAAPRCMRRAWACRPC